MESISIHIDDVSKTYANGEGISNISLSVKRGELVGLIGPDGAGKTTILRIITTLLLADKGMAMVEGFDCHKQYKNVRRIIGYMPGRFSLYQDLTVEENLKFFATIFGTTIEENYELIRPIYSQIEPFKNRRAGALSGGMKQKLALSCSLIHKPSVLILDEPTTGVDAVSRREFWEMLKGIKEKDIAILVSTPYMDEASLCDRVALMQDGKIMQIGTPAHITSQFAHTLYSVKSENMYAILKSLRTYPLVHSVFPFGQKLHLTLTSGDAADAKHFLQTQGFEEVTIEQIVPNIEDCFMELMSSKKTEV